MLKPLLFFIVIGLLQAQQTDPLKQAQVLVEAGKFGDAESGLRAYLKSNPASADAHYLLGYVLFKENNPKASLAEYAEGARYRAPGALELEVIGGDYFLLEDYANADKWLTQSIEQNRNNALGLYLLGRTKYNEKHFDEAAQLFSECLKLDPKNYKAQENLGLAYERLGKNDQALGAYKSAMALDGARDAGPYLDGGTLLLNENRVAEAISYLTQAAQLAAHDPVTHRELGKAYMLSGQLENAQSELEKAVQLDPQSAPAHFLLAQLYHKRGLTDKAAAEIKSYTALSGSHSSPDDPLAEARALVESGKLTDAAQVVRRYLEVHKNSADGHFLLGYILFKQRDAKSSLAEYTEGAKYRTPSAYDLEAVGGDYVLLHDYLDADKWFTQSAEWNPGNFQVLYYLGRTKYNENRFDEAVAVFQRCLKLDPKSVKAEDNLGLSYQGLGRNDDAMKAFRTAIAWQEGAAVKDSAPYVDLGSLLVDMDRASEALPYLLEALKISPNDMRVHRELGKTYMHLNELEKAEAELEKSAQLAPDNAPIHFLLAQVYRKQGFADKARMEAERYTALASTHSEDQ